MNDKLFPLLNLFQQIFRHRSTSQRLATIKERKSSEHHPESRDINSPVPPIPPMSPINPIPIVESKEDNYIVVRSLQDCNLRNCHITGSSIKGCVLRDCIITYQDSQKGNIPHFSRKDSIVTVRPDNNDPRRRTRSMDLEGWYPMLPQRIGRDSVDSHASCQTCQNGTMRKQDVKAIEDFLSKM